MFDTVTRQVASGIYQADEYDIRRLETRVMIPSGNTLVMGGMVQDDVRRSNTKVPYPWRYPSAWSCLPQRYQVPAESQPARLHYPHNRAGSGFPTHQDQLS